MRFSTLFEMELVTLLMSIWFVTFLMSICLHQLQRMFPLILLNGFSLCLHGVLKCMCESVLNDMLQGVSSLPKSYLTSYSSVKASSLGLLRCPALSPPLRKAYKPLLDPHSLNKAWNFSPGNKPGPLQNWPHLLAISQGSLFFIA